MLTLNFLTGNSSELVLLRPCLTDGISTHFQLEILNLKSKAFRFLPRTFRGAFSRLRIAVPKGIANVVKLFASLISGHSGRVRYSLKASTSGKELVSLGMRFFSKLAATYST